MLRARISELESEKAQLQAVGGGGVLFGEGENATNVLASPARSNRPAAAVLAQARFQASEAQPAREPYGNGVTAASAPPEMLAAAHPSQPALSTALWAIGAQRVQKQQELLRATQRGAAHNTVCEACEPSLREDFLVASHRLRWAGRTIDSWVLLSSFCGWRREVTERRRRDVSASLLLRRVLRRAAHAALTAWRDAALEQAPARTQEDAQAQQAQQSELVRAALLSAEEARLSLQRQHALELSALRQSVAAQADALTRALKAAQIVAAQAHGPHAPHAAHGTSTSSQAPAHPNGGVPLQQQQPHVEEPWERERRARHSWQAMAAAQSDAESAAHLLLVGAPVGTRGGVFSPGGPSVGTPSRREGLLLHVTSTSTPSPASPPRARAPRPVFATSMPPTPPAPARPQARPVVPTAAAGAAASSALLSVAQLVIAGWTREQASQALAATAGELALAKRWLLDNGKMPQAAAGCAPALPSTPGRQL